jgi:hypothetical protein
MIDTAWHVGALASGLLLLAACDAAKEAARLHTFEPLEFRLALSEDDGCSNEDCHSLSFVSPLGIVERVLVRSDPDLVLDVRDARSYSATEIDSDFFALNIEWHDAATSAIQDLARQAEDTGSHWIVLNIGEEFVYGFMTTILATVPGKLFVAANNAVRWKKIVTAFGVPSEALQAFTAADLEAACDFMSSTPEVRDACRRRIREQTEWQLSPSPLDEILMADPVDEDALWRELEREAGGSASETPRLQRD